MDALLKLTSGKIDRLKTGELAGSNPAALVHNQQQSMEDIRHDIAEMKAEEASLLRQRMDSSHANFLKSLLTLFIATAVAILVIAASYALLYRDVATRRRLGAYNELLLDSTGEGIYGIDSEGVCTFVNRAGAKLLGANRKQSSDKTCIA